MSIFKATNFWDNPPAGLRVAVTGLDIFQLPMNPVSWESRFPGGEADVRTAAKEAARLVEDTILALGGLESNGED